MDETDVIILVKTSNRTRDVWFARFKLQREPCDCVKFTISTDLRHKPTSMAESTLFKNFVVIHMGTVNGRLESDYPEELLPLQSFLLWLCRLFNLSNSLCNRRQMPGNHVTGDMLKKRTAPSQILHLLRFLSWWLKAEWKSLIGSNCWRLHWLNVNRRMHSEEQSSQWMKRILQYIFWVKTQFTRTDHAADRKQITSWWILTECLGKICSSTTTSGRSMATHL